MPKKTSAGILLYRRRGNALEVFLVHPGGPFWAKKDLGAWSLPKGEFETGEDPLEAAKREFTEETGFPIDGEFRALQPLRQPSGKTIFAWAGVPRSLRWTARSGFRSTRRASGSSRGRRRFSISCESLEP